MFSVRGICVPGRLTYVSYSACSMRSFVQAAQRGIAAMRSASPPLQASVWDTLQLPVIDDHAVSGQRNSVTNSDSHIVNDKPTSATVAKKGDVEYSLSDMSTRSPPAAYWTK